jgi:hydroxymethylpyrimidine/phosphomethylpyrimidine kinase
MVDTVVELLSAHRICQWSATRYCVPAVTTTGKDEVGYAMRERLLPLSIIATLTFPKRILAELPEGTADECASICHSSTPADHRRPWHEHEIHNRLYSRDGRRETFTCQRLPGSYHGSGCTLASALAGRLALGENLVSAVQTALNYTWRTLRDAEQLGKGQFVPRRLPLDFCS